MTLSFGCSYISILRHLEVEKDRNLKCTSSCKLRNDTFPSLLGGDLVDACMDDCSCHLGILFASYLRYVMIFMKRGEKTCDVHVFLLAVYA